MTVTRLEGMRVSTTALLGVSLALLVWAGDVRPDDQARVPNNPEEGGTVDPSGLQAWLEARFTRGELRALQPGAVGMESHHCGCSDTPTKHFPYVMILLRTPKGDLVARPDRRGVSVIFTALAVRHGNRYCKVDAEDDCYGAFVAPCDFTDFRYGPQLEAFFPTCKSDEEEPESGLLERTRGGAHSFYASPQSLPRTAMRGHEGAKETRTNRLRGGVPGRDPGRSPATALDVVEPFK